MAANKIQHAVARRPAGKRKVLPKRTAGRLEGILARQGFRFVAGVDEVGRGALAGPLVAAAVTLDVERLPDGVCDSKMLTAAQRERCAEDVLTVAVATSFVVVDPQDIDDDGLHVSNLAALLRAVQALRPRPDYVISDCFPLDLPVPQVGLPKADALSAAVAAASVVAKVSRDALMTRLESEFPGYGFAMNKGYGTDEHWTALRSLGASSVHRRSFRGVGSQQLALGLLGR